MSLLDMPPVPQLAGERRVHRLAGSREDDDLPQAADPRLRAARADNQEKIAMPRRKKAAAAAAATPSPEQPAPKRRGPKPGFKRAVAAPAEASFGVFEDGSVVIDTASCKGRLDAAQANRLVDFVLRLRKGRE